MTLRFMTSPIAVASVLCACVSILGADTKPRASGTKAKKPVDPIVKPGLELRQARKFDAAVDALQAALDRDLDDERRALVLFELGQTHYLRAQHSKDLNLSPEDAAAARNQALTTFEQVFRRLPQTAKAGTSRYMAGSTYLLMEKYDEALSSYLAAYREYPKYEARSRALLRAGVTLAGLDRPAEARRMYQRVIREFPQRKFDVRKARSYTQQIDIVGRPALNLTPATWQNGVVDGSAGLKTFDGEVVGVVFLATWCTSCSKALPQLRGVMERWTDAGIVFLGVLNPKDPKSTMPPRAYVEKSRLDFVDIGFIENQRVWNAYRAQSLPAVALIDRRGTVRWRGHPVFFPVPLATKLLTE